MANLVLNGPEDEETREYPLTALTPAPTPVRASASSAGHTSPPARVPAVRPPPPAGQLPRWVSQQPIQAWPPMVQAGPATSAQAMNSQARPTGPTAPTAPAAAGWPGRPDWRATARAAATATDQQTSSMVVLAAIVLLTFGALMLLVGALGFLDEDLLREMLADARVDISLPLAASALRITLGIVGVLGLLQLLCAAGVLAHGQWARYIGIALSALGTLVSVPALVDTLGSRPAATDLLIALTVWGGYAFALFALVAGGPHFRRDTR